MLRGESGIGSMIETMDAITTRPLLGKIPKLITGKHLAVGVFRGASRNTTFLEALYSLKPNPITTVVPPSPNTAVLGTGEKPAVLLFRYWEVV